MNGGSALGDWVPLLELSGQRVEETKYYISLFSHLESLSEQIIKTFNFKTFMTFINHMR